MDPRELREKRANLINQARALLEKAEGEKRDFNQEEENQYNALLNEADEVRKRYERIEHQEELDQDVTQRHGAMPLHTVQDLATDVATEDISPVLRAYFGLKETEEEKRRQARQAMTFRYFLPHWVSGDWRAMTGEELRALQADLDVSGGYLRPPEQFVNELIKAVDDQAYIRQWANTFTVTSAESLGVPTLENDPADADWTTELATGSEDSTMSLGKRQLAPKPLAKRIKISRKLIRAVPNSEQIVRDRLAYKFGITFEKACLTGAGATGPLGVFTASSDGISTGRDVSTGNTDTEIRVDGLIEAKYTLKQAYWPNARWLFHRDGVKQIAKLKDGEGQYLWRESVRVGEPDRALAVPVFMSEYAPNTFTTGLYVGIIGDFRQYWIADALTLEFQMLNELYAESNQVGLIGRLESDGMPVLEEAFVRVKLA